MNGIGYIYKITNAINGMIYIGKTNSTVSKRWVSHIWYFKRYIKQNKTSSKLYNAFNKYGIENFIYEQIDEAPIKEIAEREIYWIATLNARDPKVGYNICKGGECGPGGPMYAGHQHSQETKDKMSFDRQGSKNCNYGNHRVMPNDEKQKHACHGEKNGMYGKHQTDNSKDINRAKHINTIWVTNGTNDKQINPNDFDTYTNLGYRRGRSNLNKK